MRLHKKKKSFHTLSNGFGQLPKRGEFELLMWRNMFTWIC